MTPISERAARSRRVAAFPTTKARSTPGAVVRAWDTRVDKAMTVATRYGPLDGCISGSRVGAGEARACASGDIAIDVDLPERLIEVDPVVRRTADREPGAADRVRKPSGATEGEDQV